ncbi:MAG: SET domain-containing protein-lysine N-methyltransferase [Acidimicrobiia bacterium]|nr:SET domain-containing protein-lysine N-methyltransferase [Acidimicrobiia bacterium]MBV9043137.1 SET domain-containing protein-lysine N-methyltransferase [Acidimicrobiia bacterium]
MSYVAAGAGKPLAMSIIARTSAGDVFVAPSATHGRGVFAARAFEAGEVIEECPVLLVAADAVAELGLSGYCFEWTDDECAIALGYGSLYNHSWQPNARYDHDHDAGVVTYTAVHPIEAGEEISINYSGEPDGHVDLWFETCSF